MFYKNLKLEKKILEIILLFSSNLLLIDVKIEAMWDYMPKSKKLVTGTGLLLYFCY